jgi:hypothetical protein
VAAAVEAVEAVALAAAETAAAKDAVIKRRQSKTQLQKKRTSSNNRAGSLYLLAPAEYPISVKRLVALLVIYLLAAGCRQGISDKGSAFTLKEGDLLFQDLDCGPLCDAIEKVTTGYNGAKFTHVGIVAKDGNDNFVVIEAVSSGVQTTPLRDFLNKSFDTENRPKVAVGRLKPAFSCLIASAIKNALALRGKPYDKGFVINNDAYYCSELVYEAFLRANDNKPVFTLRPMTFKDPNTDVIFPPWQEYFSRLNTPVPEGQPGINPGGISRSPVLNIIYLYGKPDGWKKSF